MSAATNLWPALWLLGSNCQNTNIYTADTGYSTCPLLGTAPYGEVDMVECIQSGVWCQFNVFSAGPGYTPCQFAVDTNWHTFTFQWSAGSGMTEYMDGVSTGCTATISQNPAQPLFLLMQTQTTSGVTDSLLPALLTIDYVKVTQP
jgi:hypothetical protein